MGSDPWGLQIVNFVVKTEESGRVQSRRGGGWGAWDGWGTTLSYAMGFGEDAGTAAKVRAAFEQGLEDGVVITADNLMFGKGGYLHEDADRRRAANAGDAFYTVADYAGVVAREALIMAASMGVGNLARGGNTIAKVINAVMSAYDVGAGGFHVGYGLNRVANGDSGGWLEVLSGGLQVAGGIAGAKSATSNGSAAACNAKPTQPNSTREWKVGQPINNLTAKGNVPTWNAVRQRYWKNEAIRNPAGYNASNLGRMKQGRAPQRIDPARGVRESMELHHTPPQRQGGLFDVIPVWPAQHAKIDPFRRI